jgi:ribosomal protein S6--L-glutamate ligase
MTFPRLIIGWQEWVALPDLRVPAIQAKIDTGAKTSSIHAYNIEVFEKEGAEFVRFDLHPFRDDDQLVRICEAPMIDWRTVKSSGGEREKRPVIKTCLFIDGNQWEIELNLTNRDYMGFRMLLGREAMQKHTLIHPGAKYIHGKMDDTTARRRYSET